jgi:uncharacterized ubiquitin-like protein YukD
MSYVAVTLEHGREKHDLALPMQVPSRLVIDGLIHALKLSKKHTQKYYFGLQTETGIRQVSPNASLGEAGILHGAVLALLEQKQADAPPQTGAYMKSETETTYPLTTKTTLIGRNDPKSGIFVEIDLSLLASDPKAISRRHAQIEQEGDRFYIVDLGSMNGTKLNGERLPPRERKPVWDGDTIEFGRNAARLTFYGGEKK